MESYYEDTFLPGAPTSPVTPACIDSKCKRYIMKIQYTLPGRPGGPGSPFGPTRISNMYVVCYICTAQTNH